MAAQKTPIVRKVSDVHELRRDAEAISERVRQRAFELFEEHGGTGDDFHDWLRAEADTIWRPAMELIETKSGYQVELALPGVSPSDLEVRIGNGFLAVKGRRSSSRERKDDKVIVSEYRTSEIYRDVTVPFDADTDNAKVKLDNGLLVISLPRRKPAKAKAPAPATKKAKANAEGAADGRASGAKSNPPRRAAKKK